MRLLLVVGVGVMIVWLLSSNAVPVLAAAQLSLAVLQVRAVAGASGRRCAVVTIMQ
jgi:hypothetical protein